MPGNFNKLVTVITGQTITAAERNNEFDNIINNMTPDGLDDASSDLTAMQATVDPAGGSLATDLRGEIKRLRFQLLKLGAATGNWYDALPYLASLPPATAGATATDLNNRLAQIVSQIKSLSGATNWYDTLTAALLKAGGTMAGAIAMGTNKVTGLGTPSGAGDALSLGAVVPAADGSVSAPGVSFASELTTGLYKIGTANLGIAVGGVKALDIKPAGAANATTYTPLIITNAAGAALLYVVRQSTTGVTSATTIFDAGAVNVVSLLFVMGTDGSNSFGDCVFFPYAHTVTVLASGITSNTPAARTYSVSSGTLKVAMASGTYTVTVVGFNV